MSVNSKMTALADEIRELSGTEEAMGLDAMADHVGEANEDVATEADLITQIVSALEGKVGGGSNSESIETCTARIGGNAKFMSGVSATQYYDGTFTSYISGRTTPMIGYTIPNVVIGSVITVISENTSNPGISSPDGFELLQTVNNVVMLKVTKASGQQAFVAVG